jgi:hypothetical protein
MPSRKKIDLQKVLAYLNTPCPKCAKEITPTRDQARHFRHFRNSFHACTSS